MIHKSHQKRASPLSGTFGSATIFLIVSVRVSTLLTATRMHGGKASLGPPSPSRPSLKWLAKKVVADTFLKRFVSGQGSGVFKERHGK